MTQSGSTQHRIVVLDSGYEELFVSLSRASQRAQEIAEQYRSEVDVYACAPRGGWRHVLYVNRDGIAVQVD